MKKSCSKFLVSIFIIACNLVGCKDWNQPCIDPDDFGFHKMNISARGGDTTYGHDLSVSSYKGQEVTTWTDARLTLTGSRLVILVKNGENSRWTAWWGTSVDTDNVPLFLRSLRACTNSDWGCSKTVDTSVFYDPNNICLFTKGVGLYALAVPKGTDPNASEPVLKKIPNGSIAFHLGESTPLIDSDGVSSGGWNDSPPTEAPANGYLYLKILDSYYDDNGGQYQLVFKSGVADPYPGPIATVVGWVKYQLDNVTNSIYNNLINETEYLIVVRICLVLYIMFLGIAFMFGIVSITQKELAVHIFKIALIIQVSATAMSWNFFNDTFLDLFKKGVDSLVCIMVGSLGGVGCDAGASPLNYFDNLVSTFTSFETNAKIQSLLFTSFLGFVFVLIFYASLIVYMIAIAKAVILYLLAYIAICVLITLFPIFLVFILFKMTRELFNNWLKQIIGYSIQPLMVLAGLTLMAQVVLHQLHVLVGFPVCVQTVLEIPSPFNIPLIVYWYPKHVRTDPTKDLKSIDVPEYWSRDGDIFAGCDPDQKNFACKNANLCAPYECRDNRYPDLPYLIPADSSKANDQTRIDSITSGTYVTFFDVFLFFVLIYIMLKFQKIVPDIAKGVAGVVIGSYTDLSGTADSAFKGITGGALTQLAYNRLTGGRDLSRDVDAVKERVMLTGLNHSVQDSIGGGIDTMHSKMGKKLTPRPLQKLIDRNKRGEEYKHALQDSVGGKIDSVKEVGRMLKDQALYNATGGHFGKSMNDKVNPYGEKYEFYKDPNQVRINLDGVAERFGEAFGIKPEYNQELKGIFDNASGNIVGGNDIWAKYIIGGTLLANPLVGTALGGLYSAGTVGNMANQIYNLRKRSIQSSGGRLGDAGPGTGGGFGPSGTNLGPSTSHTPTVRRTGLDRTGANMLEQAGPTQSVRKREVKKFEDKKRN